MNNAAAAIPVRKAPKCTPNATPGMIALMRLAVRNIPQSDADTLHRKQFIPMYAYMTALNPMVACSVKHMAMTADGYA